jgi:protein-disulfide isomerase
MIRAIVVLVILASATLAQPSVPGKARGVSAAAITIEVFSDFQCPSCKVLHDATIKPLLAEYVSKGRVYLVNREFPLQQHAYAREAAAWATAAARVGKYDAVGDALFAHQEEWAKDGRVEAVVTPALNAAEVQKVRALAKSPEVAAEVERDVQKGRAANIQQTPTMIISHKGKTYPVAGSVSFAILRRFLDELLTK